MTVLHIAWKSVAPLPPANPADPSDPAYRWASLDRQIQLSVANGLTPVVSIFYSPTWAQDGSDNEWGWRDWRVNPVQFGLFARALAQRYSGALPGVPRVRYWSAWNEPNLSYFLNPQYGFAAGGSPRPFDFSVKVSPYLYRALLTEFARGVRSVRADNLVVAGNLGPFTHFGPTSPASSVGPLRFMRDLLCMSGGARPREVCGVRVPFDIWATHPYTSGGPTRHASGPDDVSLGDLPQMKRLLDASVRAGQVDSAHRVRFWVTEFSWDTKPPDRYGVPLKLHARWVAEALYRMWKAGVSMVTWYSLRDEARPGFVQGGLYFRNPAGVARDRAKPALAAFRFPLVAFRQGKQVLVWGRTPSSRPRAVVIEQMDGARGRRLRTLRANRYGIFSAKLSTRAGGAIRARIGGSSSLWFSLRRPAPLIVFPFGEQPAPQGQTP